jgi:CDP-diacylglycerol--glycerol-3-phosphate 3-phosphatidyltransferase
LRDTQFKNQKTMASIYQLKPRFQSLLRPLVRHLANAGITANGVTLAAMLISLALGALLGAMGGEHRMLFLLLPLWMFLRMAFNAIDGMLAREFGQQSALGAYLNELSDVISDAALYLPFVVIAPFGWASVGAVVFLAAVSEMTGPKKSDGSPGHDSSPGSVGACWCVREGRGYADLISLSRSG